MMVIEHKTNIQATPELVWSVTMDIENWPTWNPTVKKANRMESSALGLGSKVRIKQPWQPTSDWEITLFEDRKRFAWETRRAGLRMEATHILEPHGGGTKNILRLEVSGVFLWCLYPLLRLALSRENGGLKRHCETITASKIP